jgi:hypothetical protein
MILKEALNDKKFDVRLRDRLNSEGKITKEEMDAYLKQLDDSSANADIQELED